MAETFVDANGIQLCVETFGRAEHPCILLIMGATASFLEVAQRMQALEPDDPRFAAQQAELYQALSGPGRSYDEASAGKVSRREMQRADNYQSSANHEYALLATPPWRHELSAIQV